MTPVSGLELDRFFASDRFIFYDQKRLLLNTIETTLVHELVEVFSYTFSLNYQETRFQL